MVENASSRRLGRLMISAAALAEGSAKVTVIRFAATLAIALATATPISAERATIIVASTTSTQNSGLFDLILPIFEEQTGIRVKVVAVGTGQAIRLAKRGDADVLLVHDRLSEEDFVREGFGVERLPIMYNDFVLLGPAEDPAGVRGMSDAPAALAKLARARAPFVSRGDHSGTHKAELRLWKAAGLDPRPDSGQWYLETGAGQGPSLNTASEMNAYLLSDKGTWLSFKNPGQLEILVQGDPRLHNPYAAILVNRDRHPHVKAEEGAEFIAWLRSPIGQRAIASLQHNGESLFTPNAKPD